MRVKGRRGKNVSSIGGRNTEGERREVDEGRERGIIKRKKKTEERKK